MRRLDYREEFDTAYCYFTAWGYYRDDENQDVLALLLAATDEAGQPLSDKEIRDELVTFLVDTGD